MINMIKADLYRVFRGKGIYLAILLAVIMASSSIYVMQPGYIGLTSSDRFPVIQWLMMRQD